MSTQAQAILEQALRLSTDEWAHLADELQRSLDPGDPRDTRTLMKPVRYGEDADEELIDEIAPL